MIIYMSYGLPKNKKMITNNIILKKKSNTIKKY